MGLEVWEIVPGNQSCWNSNYCLKCLRNLFLCIAFSISSSVLLKNTKRLEKSCWFHYNSARFLLIGESKTWLPAWCPAVLGNQRSWGCCRWSPSRGSAGRSRAEGTRYSRVHDVLTTDGGGAGHRLPVPHQDLNTGNNLNHKSLTPKCEMHSMQCVFLYLESQCRGEAVCRPVQGSQHWLEGLFYRWPGEQTVLCGEESQQPHIHHKTPEDRAVPQGHRPRYRVWRVNKRRKKKKKGHFWSFQIKLFYCIFLYVNNQYRYTTSVQSPWFLKIGIGPEEAISGTGHSCKWDPGFYLYK